ncbi:MAG: efflux RND transporter periplasmic adaptor subunit [Deltaproteobacteria bacterium]|jgi:HlyD family secretion protein|nr:efflux RND transporter periplasmic adaptor subunit [Deltaproteobacteria bacterium]
MVLASLDPERLRKWRFRALVVIGIVAAIFLLEATVLAPKPIPVKTTVVRRGVIDSTVTNSKAGTIRARQRARLSTEIGGRVVEITHREGGVVAQGELLLLLNDSTLRAQETQAIEAIRASDAHYKEACITRDKERREYNRKRKLADQNIVSEDLLDQLLHVYQAAKAACDAADAERQKVRASRAGVAADLDKVSIYAPFPGVIAEVNVEVGEWVTPSPEGIIDLINRESLYVSAPMDEIDSGRIELGQPVRVTVDSRPDETFLGKVTRIAPYVLDIEAQNRTVEIEVELDDPEIASGLLPGTSADVEVILNTLEDAPRIPTTALFQNNRVLVVEDDELVEREVEIGLRNWDYAEIKSGLEEGEVVVTSLDRVEVEAGQTVEVIQPDDVS